MYDGLPPLEPNNSVKNGMVVFTNVSSFWGRKDGEIAELHSFGNSNVDSGTVVVDRGYLICVGKNLACGRYDADPSVLTVDLQGGSVAPGLTAYGTNLGLQEIAAEPSTSDGYVSDALTERLPGLLGEDALIRAVDGLQFSTRDAQ